MNREMNWKPFAYLQPAANNKNKQQKFNFKIFIELENSRRILFKLFNCESSTLIEYRWVEENEYEGEGEKCFKLLNSHGQLRTNGKRK